LKAPTVNPTEKKFIQKVCGKFLFYGRAVHSTVLTPIRTIASQSANPTKETLAHTNQLLDYLTTQEEAVLTYNRSEMVMAALCIVAVTSGRADSCFFEALALIGVTCALAAANHCTLTLSPNK
jgi:hypothetical protein